MDQVLFLPTMRQTAVLAALGLAGLAIGLTLRYLVIEQAALGVSCADNGATWLCAVRRGAIALFTPSAFGLAALGAALLNLIRPHVVLCAVALLAGGTGIVLYNVALSALAGALLVLSLARPAPEPG